MDRPLVLRGHLVVTCPTCHDAPGGCVDCGGEGWIESGVSIPGVEEQWPTPEETK